MVLTGCQSRNKGGVGQVNGSYSQSRTRAGVGQVNGSYRLSVKEQGWGWTSEWFIQAVSQGTRVGLDK